MKPDFRVCVAAMAFILSHVPGQPATAQQSEKSALPASAFGAMSPEAQQKISERLRPLFGSGASELRFRARHMHLQGVDTPNPILHALIRFSGDRSELAQMAGGLGAKLGDIYSARIPLRDLPRIAGHPGVLAIQPAARLYPENDLARADSQVEPVWGKTATIPPAYLHYSGKNVIVGVIDTGIDWDHGDFIDDSTGESRILSLWDQTLTPEPGESSPAGYAYGVEYTRAQINDEIDGTPAGYVRSRDTHGHGTHVTGIAAGDGSDSGDPSYAPRYTYTGMAPEADIVMVKYGGGGFEDVVADAIAYIFNQADMLGRPAVINISLGTHSGAHDGTSLLEQAIDNAVGAGKVVVNSAGNSGTDAGHAEYIHAEGTVSDGTSTTFEITVPAYTQAPGAGNDFLILDMWYQGGDSLTVTIERPNGSTVTATTGNSTGQLDTDGYVGLFNAETGQNANNGDHECYVEIWDVLSGFGPAPGTWRITITGAAITESGHIDAWITTSSLGAGGLPCYFTSGWEDDEITSIPGTARRGITVGAYSTKRTFDSQDGNTYAYTDAVEGDIAYFSSYGVREDAAAGLLPYQKPEICGSGYGVVSSLSTDSPLVGSAEQIRDLTHVIMAGTSMSAPHVTGIVALLLEQNPAYTADEIKTLLTAHARQDSFTSAVPNLKWGYGKVDAAAAAGALRAPAAISDLSIQKGSVILNWSDVETDVAGDHEYTERYTIYRSTAPFFAPGAADSIGTTTTSSFTDTSSSVIGDPNQQYYYYVLAVDDFGNSSAASNHVGEYDVALISPPGKTNNFVPFVFQNSGITTASELAAAIGPVDLISRWSAASQAWGSYIPGVSATDFALNWGEPYMVSVTRDTTFTQMGEAIRGKTFNLISPPGKTNNAITIPLERTDLTLASEVAADIGDMVDLISRWFSASQAWGSYVPGVSATDFPVYPGMPLMVSVTAPVTWPEMGSRTSNISFVQRPGERSMTRRRDARNAIPIKWHRPR